MNEASATICSEKPSLLSSRKDLLEKAREKVHSDGYNFVKGKSRSKRLNTCATTTLKKNIRSTGEVRAKRMKELEEDHKDTISLISFKENRRDQAEAARNYKTCEDLTQEISHLKEKNRLIDAEIGVFSKKSKRATSYRKKKHDSVPFSDPESEPLSNLCLQPLPPSSSQSSEQLQAKEYSSSDVSDSDVPIASMIPNCDFPTDEEELIPVPTTCTPTDQIFP